jgi:Anti-sigma-K factor rskA, C-terminal
MKHPRLTDELQEQASLYAAGAMTESERRDYARHLEEDDCAVCRRETQEFQAATALLAVGLDPLTPSQSVKDRLMASVANVSPVQAPKPRLWVVWLAAMEAVAASVLLFVAFSNNAELRRTAQALRSQVQELQARIAEQQVQMASLTSTDVQITNLAGQGANSGARARLFWDQQRRHWSVYVNDLPPAPANRSYQLWFVPKAGNPVSAGVFNTEPNGSAVVEADVPAGLDLMAAAVTTEPAGGLPQPTGPFALLGAF